MDKDNWILGLAGGINFALQHLTTGITNISIVENNGKTYMRCALTTGGHVDLVLKSELKGK